MSAHRGDPCTITGCTKPILGRGWCSMHYATWQRHGNPEAPIQRRMPTGMVCSIDGCDRRATRRRMCSVCARRIANHGEATDPRVRRFWTQVDKREPEECWPWAGYIQPNGYGTRSNHNPGETRLVHRIAYEYLVGPIPAGLVLDHLCHTRDPQCADNDQCRHRRCCNPSHLEPVTPRENIARGRGGDSWGYVPAQIPPAPKAVRPSVCTEADCDGDVYKRTICRRHYRRWLRDPSVERPSQRTPEQRFWAKVDRRGDDECWLWTAAVNRGTGYGQFARRHGEGCDAHRFSYELTHGQIPAGHDVHHTCHMRHCVNPAHLAAVTRSANMAARKVRR
jgi:hypothetical protein